MNIDHTYTWIDASVGTELGLSDDDSAQVQLPFEFTYYNNSFSNVYVSSNGYLSFTDSTADEYNCYAFPLSYSTYRYMIAPFWDDIYPQLSGNIYVLSFTDYWIAEWQDVQISNPSQTIFGTCSFQAILYKNGDIVFNYDYISLNLESHYYTAGLNLGINTQYFNEYNGLSISTNDLSILFEAPLPPKSFILSADCGSQDDDGNFTKLGN